MRRGQSSVREDNATLVFCYNLDTAYRHVRQIHTRPGTLSKQNYSTYITYIDNWLEGVINKTLVLMCLVSPQAKL